MDFDQDEEVAPRPGLGPARFSDPCVTWESPEFRLAALCCRHPWSDGNTAELRVLLARVDAAVFIDLVLRRHRIGPLAAAALGRLAPADVPPVLRQALAAEVRANAIRALLSQRAHVLLARKLEDAGIPWMVFKGVTLAARYYGDAAARHVNDIDLWAPAGQRDQARNVLTALGYEPAGEPVPWQLALRGPRHAAFIDRYFIEEVFNNKESGVLELHWGLAVNTYQFMCDPAAIHARGGTVPMGGVQLRVMSDVDLLLYLCEHGARHRWSRLKWLADLPRVLHSRHWDWPEVFQRAREAGCEKSLALGLVLCRQVLGCPMPDSAGACLEKVRLPNLAVSLVRVTQEGPEFVEKSTFKQAVLLWRELLNSLVLATSVRSVVYQVLRALISSKDMMLVSLPDRCFFGYYLLRPLLLPVRRALCATSTSAAPVTKH